MAFLLCVNFSDLGGLRWHRSCVTHPLIGRYVLHEVIERWQISE
ncbi:DUF3265 domain-containing protein [Vibrio parahaemolyticus]|nr:DUF3265 domain-containing protein [Vibrio parahaemolyticus]EGR3355986.1 DUF3265 domain-containing protein [Vibrio parahaemolyticus]EJG1852796.1 DUF3265 domain-containing protein [Vibrio parahaemolyticus]ELI1808694.1 DUF3265 domain-containing protein [Vibrio parahaemolyticus]HCG7294159.1 DUF3265 domain-containing protein [Vibrio parahaemolyticus]